jgi:hypothetical protein
MGVVTALWRYPVKSMRGERLAEGEFGERGLDGDRLYAVRDPDGKFGSGKNTRRMPGLGVHASVVRGGTLRVGDSHAVGCSAAHSP